MADVVQKAADTIKDTAKAVDPASGESAPMHGRVAIVTGGNAGKSGSVIMTNVHACRCDHRCLYVIN